MDTHDHASRALALAVTYLRCPVCAGHVHLSDRQLACGQGHSFDVARQGYVSLTAGRAGPGTADTPGMVAARDGFLARGHYLPLATAIGALAARHDRGGPGLAVDLAGGTAYYLARVLDVLPHRHGVCVDLSAPALRRAARAHPRAAAVGADVWRSLPLADQSAALVLSIFGPRNAAETARVLAPDGTLIIASPGAGHLRELLRPLGLIGIDPGKDRRLSDTYRGYVQAASVTVNYQVSLDQTDLATLVAMGPNARHITPQAQATRIRALPAPATVTIDLRIRAWQRDRPPAESLANPGQGARRTVRSVRIDGR